MLALGVLAAAAFVYVTAELMPVGALPAIAGDLDVSEALVATLLASYALVAALATVPLVRWTARWPRRRALALTLSSLTVSQLISALAPTFTVLIAGRVLCALTHGLMWSVIAPIAVRLVPPSHAARATVAVYIGTSLALVVGSPLTAALSQLWGWRAAVGVIAAASAAVLLAARLTLPLMTMPPGAARSGPRWSWRHRNRRLVIMCALTLVGVTGHFISYSFIVVLIRDVVGVGGPALAWLLAGYGIAGLLAMALLAKSGDRSPKATIVACMAGLTAVFAVLAGLGFGLGSDRGHGALAVTLGVAAILGWGATATAVPPMLQTAAMRHSPEDPDGASGLYVAAFQIGIMAGALIGGVLFEHAGEPLMLTASGLLIASALVCVVAIPDLFVPAVGSGARSGGE